MLIFKYILENGTFGIMSGFVRTSKAVAIRARDTLSPKQTLAVSLRLRVAWAFTDGRLMI